MKRQLMCVALLAALGGCSSDQDELHQWMEQQRKEAKPSVTPLLPPKKFLPQPYESAAGLDPFSTQKLTVAIRQEAAQPNSLLTAEINRRKEPLEAYPLDGVPSLGIGGLYLTSPRMAQGGENLPESESGRRALIVTDYLIRNFGKV